MRSFIAFAAAIALAGSAMGQDAISWRSTSDGQAVSSISTTGTTLFFNPTGAQQSGAQFLYTKNFPATRVIPLARVFLREASSGREWLLQEGFAALPQECSCYYIDAKELASRQGVSANGRYALRFAAVDNSYSFVSGAFSLNMDGFRPTTTSTTATPTTTRTSSTSTSTSTSPSSRTTTSTSTSSGTSTPTSGSGTDNTTPTGTPPRVANGGAFLAASGLIPLAVGALALIPAAYLLL